MNYITSRVHSIKKEGDVVVDDRIVPIRLYIYDNIESVHPHSRGTSNKLDHTLITFDNDSSYNLAESYDSVCKKLDKMYEEIEKEELLIKKN